MILQDKRIVNVQLVGMENTKTAKINQDKIAKLQYILTNGLYSDGIGSTIVEITNNALDSIIQSGKDPMENPVYVYLETNSSTGRYQLRITDNGLGLNEEEFENTVMNYLTSTKEDNNDTIGVFGIGAKSWCSVSNTATFICRKDGVEYNFLCFKGEDFLKYDKVYQKETTEENGVVFILPIKDQYEYVQFGQKARQKLAYYDNVVLTIGGKVEPNTIHRSEYFQWSTMSSTNKLHFSLKDVYYQLDFEKLGIEPVNIPVCLRFGLSEGLTPSPSRETIIYTQETKTLILNKIKNVALWFKEKYDSDIKEYKTLLEGSNDIGVDKKKVVIAGKEFIINNLIEAAGVETADVVIEGIKLRKPSFYKSKISELLDEYQVVATGAGRNRFSSRLYHSDLSATIRIVPAGFSGNFRKYMLGENCNYSDKFVIHQPSKRKLGTKRGSIGYQYMLDLAKIPKDQWREYIKEFQYVQKTITDKFVNATDWEVSEEYLEWLKEYRQELKDKRASSAYGANYIALNKQKGEITLSVAREQKYHQDVVFDKGKAPINTLHKLGHLSVYFTKEQVEENRNFIYKAMKAFPKVKFVLLNEREIKYVKALKQFKTKEEFMFSKPLKRYITANLIEEYLHLAPDNQVLIYETFPKYVEMKKKLYEYVKENSKDADEQLFKELRETAKENQLFDMEIYPLAQEFKKIMEDFSFLKYLKTTVGYTSDSEKAVINNLIYIMLKAKRVTGKTVDEFDLVPKVLPMQLDEAIVETQFGTTEYSFEAGDVEILEPIGEDEVPIDETDDVSPLELEEEAMSEGLKELMEYDRRDLDQSENGFNTEDDEEEQYVPLQHLHMTSI